MPRTPPQEEPSPVEETNGQTPLAFNLERQRVIDNIVAADYTSTAPTHPGLPSLCSNEDCDICAPFRATRPDPVINSMIQASRVLDAGGEPDLYPSPIERHPDNFIVYPEPPVPPPAETNGHTSIESPSHPSVADEIKHRYQATKIKNKTVKNNTCILHSKGISKRGQVEITLQSMFLHRYFKKTCNGKLTTATGAIIQGEHGFYNMATFARYADRVGCTFSLPLNNLYAGGYTNVAPLFSDKIRTGVKLHLEDPMTTEAVKAYLEQMNKFVTNFYNDMIRGFRVESFLRREL